MKTILTTVFAATVMLVISGCGNDTTAKPTKSAITKRATENKPKSADEEFDTKYLKNVRTVTKVPELEMELYRKATRKTLAELEGADAENAVKARGITMDDYRKMMVEGLVKELQGKLRTARRDVSGETQQKVLLQGIIDSL